MSELAKRIAFAVVAVPVVVGLAWSGGLPFAALVAGAAAIASWEFYRLAAATGVMPLRGHGVVLSAIVPLAVFVRYEYAWAPAVGVLMLVVLELLSVALWARGPAGMPLEAVGVTLLGVFYTGGMLAFGVALRHHRFAIDALAGTLLVALPLVLTWGTDTGAMLFGRLWGKTKLMPSISPGKTIAGAWGGVVVSMVVAMFAIRFALQPYARFTMSAAASAAFGLVVSVAGQVGDLVESMFKRQAGVKDSSALIPGHGGALDRIDSLLFTLPVAYVLYGLLLTPTP